jgi:ATP synthase protein I
LAEPNQYGPRGFSGRLLRVCGHAAGVEAMSDGTRENGKRGKARTDEAALSARLQRLGEGLARESAKTPADDAGVDRAATASGYAKGFRLSSELVGGVLVGAGLGWLIDRLLGISPWGFIVFLLLGFVAGVLNVMRSAGVVPGNTQGTGTSGSRQQ